MDRQTRAALCFAKLADFLVETFVGAYDAARLSVFRGKSVAPAVHSLFRPRKFTTQGREGPPVNATETGRHSFLGIVLTR
ncbi:hypothetical protein AYO40_00350 [Planctomycetaceae bacterium SCGC AG-212-D15]|nr:hypothetical protein AYO40_00350 [Planctomycetaceae bacterium SCGC AG-212-D15]